jgi:predicted small secreted protein
MRRITRLTIQFLLLLCALSTSGCSDEVGVGISVGVPVGNYEHTSVLTSSWY